MGIPENDTIKRTVSFRKVPRRNVSSSLKEPEAVISIPLFRMALRRSWVGLEPSSEFTMLPSHLQGDLNSRASQRRVCLPGEGHGWGKWGHAHKLGSWACSRMPSPYSNANSTRFIDLIVVEERYRPSGDERCRRSDETQLLFRYYSVFVVQIISTDFICVRECGEGV